MNKSYDFSSLNELALKEKRTIDRLTETTYLVANEEKREERLIQQISALDCELNEEKSPFYEVLEKQILEADKEYSNVKHKIRNQLKLSEALDELLNALNSSPLKKPNVNKKTILKSYDETCEVIRSNINATIKENIKLKEQVDSIIMKRNIQLSEKMRINDYITLLKRKQQEKKQEIAQSQYKTIIFNEKGENYNKVYHNIKEKRKRINKKYKALMSNVCIQNLINLIDKDGYFNRKITEYNMRVNVAEKMINQFEMIIDKVENESEKLSFDLDEWMNVLNQVTFSSIDVCIDNIKLLGQSS